MNNAEDEISYREFVQRYVKTNELSSDDYDTLETYRAYLKLLPDQARRIEQEVFKSQGGPPSSDVSKINTPDSSVPVQKIEPPKFQFQQKQPDLLESNTETIAVPFGDNSIQQVRSSDSQVLSTHSPNSPVPATKPISIDTTMIPPKPPEHYFAHRQQYGQEFLQALRAEGFNLGNETRERLHKLATQLELSGSDVADIERTMLVEVYLKNSSGSQSPSPSSKATPPPSIEEKYNPDLRELFNELEASLKAKEFQSADIATFNILLQVIRPAEDWLDEVSLKRFSTANNASSNQDKNAIQEIDRLWDQYSDGNFGFSQQLQLYSFGAVPSNDKDLDKDRREHRILALAFSRSTQWWIDGLEFFKYYNQLDFTDEAPRGHLPAWWFWKIPRPKAFQYGGLGLLKERGGCRIDAYTLPAFMYVLKKCGIKPR